MRCRSCRRAFAETETGVICSVPDGNDDEDGCPYYLAREASE